MKRWLMAGVLLVNVGCLKGIDLTDSTPAVSDAEMYIVQSTARHSGIAGQNVKGEISETFYQVTCLNGVPGCHAFGWYVGKYGKGAKGTAFFYKTDVNKYANDRGTLDWAAAHEVCHSITGAAHDEAHSNCNLNLYGNAAPASARFIACAINGANGLGEERNRQ